MTTFAHDGAASLRVRSPDVVYIVGRKRRQRKGELAGWYVVRTCPCHFGQRITEHFDSREQAERALAALDLDARRYGA